MGQYERGEWKVADYLIASKKCDLLSLEQLLHMGKLVVCISNLVHVLQRERGASNIFVGSGGTRFADQLPQRVEESCAMAEQFRACLEGIDTQTGCHPGSSRLFSGLAYVIQGLDELKRVRSDILSLRISPEAIIDGYSELIRGLLAVVFDAADSAADPDISRILVAMFHLMQGKELAGQERALGAAGFARGSFDNGQRERFRHLIESQERYFQIFATFANPESLALWQAITTEPCTAELERLRRVALAAADGRADTALSDTWYDESTRRIDLFKEVEDRLEAHLTTLCEQKIADARADLDSHCDQLQALAQQPTECGAFAIFLNSGDGDAEAGNDPGPYSTECASPQLGRSLIDLVQSQSVRLQAMSEELNEARTALTERKVIEKAKGLIMKHRQMSEEDAFRFMREVAMSQQRKLVDVASDTINMVELFKKTR